MQWKLLVCLIGGFAAAATAATNAPANALTIPYEPTRSDTVKDILWMADTGTNDVVYDLGSGDGRIVIAAVRDFHARKAVGIEIKPELVRQSRATAARAGVADRVEFTEGDLFTNDFSQASVVTLYLGHQQNIQLRSKFFRTLNPGTRIISHKFGMGEWRPDKELSVRLTYLGICGQRDNPFADNPRVPDYGSRRGCGGGPVAMWVVPATAAGIWRGKVSMADGDQELELTLHQRLSEVTGSFQIVGRTNATGQVRADLWGDHLRFQGSGPYYGKFRLMFDGHLQGDRLQGTLAVFQNDSLREFPWEAQRDKADFTGTWEWPGPGGNQSVRLQIERRNGESVATYLANGKTLPVTDFYDFGGGFYFTLFLGREGQSMLVGPNAGWLVGEGIVEQDTLKGTVEFYPSGHMSAGKETPQPVKTWLPQRVKP